MTGRNTEMGTAILIFIGVVLTFGASDIIQSKIAFLNTSMGRWVLFIFAILLFMFSNKLATKVFPNVNSLGNRYFDTFIDRLSMIIFFFVLSIWLAPIIALNPYGAFAIGIFAMIMAPIFSRAIFKGG